MPARGSGNKPKTSTTNGAELARFAGVSGDTIKEWRRVADFPGGREGPTVLLEFARWYFRRIGVITTGDEEKSEAQRFKDAEIRDKEATAFIKEVKARNLAGELVDRRAARTRMSLMLSQVRARLQAIPQELASALPPNLRLDITRDFEAKIRLILTEMIAWGHAEGLPSETPPAISKPSRKASKPPKTSGNATKRSPPAKNRRGSRGRVKT